MREKVSDLLKEKERKKEKKPLLFTDFSILFFLVTVMALSSSNPLPNPTMVAGDDSQNPTADVEIVGAGPVMV